MQSQTPNTTQLSKPVTDKVSGVESSVAPPNSEPSMAKKKIKKKKQPEKVNLADHFDNTVQFISSGPNGTGRRSSTPGLKCAPQGKFQRRVSSEVSGGSGFLIDTFHSHLLLALS